VASLTAFSAAQNIETTVNGSPVYFPDVQPMKMHNRVMVPLRGVFEQMGAEVEWNEAMQQVTATTPTHTVILHIGDRYATVDGQRTALDTPAMTWRGRTLVPLRFVGQSLGADVAWNEPNMVAITTSDYAQETGNGYNSGGLTKDTHTYGDPMTIEENTVVPLKLNKQLASDTSNVGDTFTATVDTKDMSDYQGLPSGTMVEGHVDTARAKTDKSPGVLGLEYDRIVLPGGKSYALDASPYGLDDKSVTDENGRLVAKNSSSKGKDTLKYVGYGAGGGTLIALLTHGNILTDALIGGALGYVFDLLKKHPDQSNNVLLHEGDRIGMRMDKRLTFYTTNR
jgi:hypothetical protein